PRAGPDRGRGGPGGLRAGRRGPHGRAGRARALPVGGPARGREGRAAPPRPPDPAPPVVGAILLCSALAARLGRLTAPAPGRRKQEVVLARFFKFRSLADLEAECRRLGTDLRFSEDLSPLFRPVAVGPLRTGNGLCIQPMEGCDGTLDGRPDELTFRRYRRFGAGGAKVIWGEATAVLEEGRANSRPRLLTEESASALERMLRECRQAHREAFGADEDLVVGLQLTHSGRYSYRRPLIAFHDPILDPRTVADKTAGRSVDAG